MIPDAMKLTGLKSIINHFVPNRWEHCRKPDEKELNAIRGEGIPSHVIEFCNEKNNNE